MRKIYLIPLLLLLAIAVSAATIEVPEAPAGMLLQEAVAVGGTPIITQDTDDGGSSPSDPASYSVGQSFTMPAGKTAIYSIKLYVHAAGSDVPLILSNDTDLTSNNIDTKTISISGTGYHEWVFNATGLTAETVYYFAVAKGSTTTTFRRATTNVYEDGAYRYGSSADSMGSTLSHEFRFIINE